MKRVLMAVSISLLVLTYVGCGSSSNDSDDDKKDSGSAINSGGVVSSGSSGDSSFGSIANAKDLVSGDKYRLLAWNDLGMHCMDGNDYSVFSILPPYNNLVAQLVEKKNGGAKKISSGVTITYEAVNSLDGKLNSSSSDKTNFWDYAKQLFGADLAKDVGLAGNGVQSRTPQQLVYSATNNWWSAEGIPTSPTNDDGSTNHYPMVKVVAKDTSGNILATTTTVLPVSDEMDCRKCHASNSSDDAKPSDGWVNNGDAQKDYKLNILRLHDDKHDISSYLAELKTKGYDYANTLSQSVANGTPVLCASCHKSNALPNTGISGIPPLTRALHSRHADVIDPESGQMLDNASNRGACYTCHPGATTQCLRGAMGKAKNSDGTMKMQCQSCHGGMSAVGQRNRDGWLDEPNCQSCHENGNRHTEAVTDFATGTLRATLDNRFATNPNTPAQGKSLYRFSTGHEGMQCSSCHGSTHAIYPSLRAEDNIQSIGVQGHAGTINECTSCHLSVPKTADKGPHGMHSVGQYWVDRHKSSAKGDATKCASCHGKDYRGSFLSKTFSKRTFSIEGKSKSYEAGTPVSCYDCHNGPDGE